MVVANFIERSIGIIQHLCEGYHAVRHQRLADVVLVRQTATLTRTAAHRHLVVSHIFFQAVNCTFVESLRVTNRCVACTTTDSRYMVSGQLIVNNCSQDS